MVSFLRRVPVLPVAVIVGVVALFVFTAVWGAGGSTPKQNTTGRQVLPAAAQFVSPLDGATVTNPVTVAMAIGGLRFAKTSEPAQPGYGHLDVIIDGTPPPVREGVPKASNIIHLDDATHVVTLPELTPGPHTLTLVFADSDEICCRS